MSPAKHTGSEKIGQTDSLGRSTYRVARQGDMSIELLLTFLAIQI